MRSHLLHPIICILVRFALGGLFIYASWHKIADPPDFAKAIYNFKLVPAEGINLVAIYLPWVELLAGIAIVTGVGLRGASVLAGALCCVFIAALAYNLARDCPTICGCFSTHGAGQSLTDAQKFIDMRVVILRDAGLLLLALHSFMAASRRQDSRPTRP